MLLAELKQTNKGTYIAYQLDEESIEEVGKYITSNQIPNPIPVDKLHVTMIYSPQHIPNAEDLINSDDTFKCKFKSFELFGEDKNVLVLSLKNKELSERHQYYLSNGAVHTYDEFNPHVTLSYDVGEDYDVSKLPKFKSPITLCKEYTEPLDIDWKDKL